MIAAFTGLVAGIIHVWSGPDHLTAIAPLAVRRPERSWVSGARWGFGHSAGVAVIGMLSLWLRDLIPTQLISTWGERMVGILLVLIGCWALRKSSRVHAHEHEHDGDRHLHLHAHTHATPHNRPEAHERHTHAAFGIGILHGLAGSSHFLGVLPILAFPSRAQSIAYLLAFALGTVMSMASFSHAMGWIATRWGAGSIKFYRGMMTCCAVMAISVGLFWLLSA